MRKYTIYGIVVFLGIAVATLSTFYIMRVNAEKNDQLQKIEELRDQLEQLQNDVSHTGGAETTPVEPRGNLSGDFVFPIAKEDFLFYSSPYGLRVSPILNIEMKHEGVDIGGVWKSQVLAVSNGTVTEHWPPPDGYFKGHPVYGGLIEIEHDNGTKSLYAHLSWTRVYQGMEVRAGEVIGRVGNTGMADGNHLHFELHMNGKTVNPLLYLPSPK